MSRILIAKRLLLQVIKSLADLELCRFRIGLQDGRVDFFSEGLDRFLACHFAGSVERRFDAIARDAIGNLEKFVSHDEEGCLALWLSSGDHQFLLRDDEMAHLFLSESQRRDEVSLRNFLGFAFNHYHLVLCSHVDKIKVARGALTVHRIDDELAINTADPNRTHGPGKRNVRDAKRRAGTIDKEDVGIVFAVGAQENSDNLRIVKIASRKEWTQRAVCHPAGKRLLLRRTPFPFEIAAGKFSNRRRFLPIINGQWKEILTLFYGRRGNSRDENNGVPGADCNCTIGESRKLACFNGDRGLANSGRNRMRHNLT